MSEILKVSQVSKTFHSGDTPLTVLKDISFSVDTGDSCAIVGPSGSGKTTLLGLCAGLDECSHGEVFVNGESLNKMDEEQRALFRIQNVGFVFQNFQLIPTLTALENVMVPLELSGVKHPQKPSRKILERVGLKERENHYPVQLSGGEQQRVALARAFVNTPAILFADEPTGNLDSDTSQSITDLLFEMNHDAGTTLILVTHDMELAGKTHSILSLKGGMMQTLSDNQDS